jgi:hypothetical protein
MMFKFCLTLSCFSLFSLCAVADEAVDAARTQEDVSQQQVPHEDAPQAEDALPEDAGPQEVAQENVAEPEEECTSEYDQLQSTLLTTMGIEGTYYLRHEGDPLTTQSMRNEDPIRVSIESMFEDCGATIYELHFESDLAGRFDLSRVLIGSDGRTPQNVAAAIVIVRELLPEYHDGQLEPLPAAALKPPLRYKLLLVLLGTLWLVPVLWYVLKLTASGR